MAENNVGLTSDFELQDFSGAASALAVAAAGGDVEQIADAVSASSSAQFTRGLVKDDIREAIASGGRASTAAGIPDHNKEALGIAAGAKELANPGNELSGVQRWVFSNILTKRFSVVNVRYFTYQCWKIPYFGLTFPNPIMLIMEKTEH